MSLWLLPKVKTFHRVAFNVSVVVISIWLASHGFFYLAGIDPRAPRYSSLAEFVVPLYVFTACCFVLNSGLVAIALSIERGQPAFRIWRNQFLWLSLNYFGGASVAALLVVYAKSIDWAVVGIIVPLLAISYLTFRTTLGRLEDAHTHLAELNRLYLSTIETLAMAIDAKDQVTHGHIRRVQRYAVGLAETLGVSDPSLLKAIEAAALLHDMGKLAIPEYILNKPGRLAPAEFDTMKRHARIGADILSSIEFPYPVIPIVRHHHENWDGSGYPDRLKGTAIPLGARILAVVDCFDALTSDRPYRRRLSTEDAVSVIVERRGTMYDPVVVDTFAKHLPELERSAQECGPESPALAEIAALNRARSLPSTTDARLTAKHGHAIQARTSEPAPFLLGGLQDLAAIALGRVAGRIPAHGCAVLLADGGAPTLETVAVSGLMPAQYLGTRTEFGRRIAGWVAANKTSAVNSPAELDLDGPAGAGGLEAALVVPIFDRDDVHGVLAFYSLSRNGFTTEHAAVAENLSSALADIVRKVKVLPDSVRTTLSSSLERAFPEGIASNRWPVGLVLAHVRSSQTSPAASQSIWRTLKSAVRCDDSLVQIDSDAYVLLLVRSDEAATTQVVSRLRGEFAEAAIDAEIEWASVTQDSAAAVSTLGVFANRMRVAAGTYTRRNTH